jgi:hypothetical protein
MFAVVNHLHLSNSVEQLRLPLQVFGPGWFHQNIAAHLASDQQHSLGEVVASSEI